MNIAQKVKSYYDTDDFKNNYMDHLMQDTHNCIDRVKEIALSSEFKKQYGTGLFLSREQAEEICNYISENIEDFIGKMCDYYVGHTSIDSVSFGEQHEQLSGLYNHKTKKDYSLRYLKSIFDKEGYCVSGDYAYLDLSGQGLCVDMLKSEIPLIEELIKNQTS